MENKTLKYTYEDYQELYSFLNPFSEGNKQESIFNIPPYFMEQMANAIDVEYKKGLSAIDVAKNVLEKIPNAHKEFLIHVILEKGGFVNRI